MSVVSIEATEGTGEDEGRNTVIVTNDGGYKLIFTYDEALELYFIETSRTVFEFPIEKFTILKEEVGRL